MAETDNDENNLAFIEKLLGEVAEPAPEEPRNKIERDLFTFPTDAMRQLVKYVRHLEKHARNLEAKAAAEAEARLSRGHDYVQKKHYSTPAGPHTSITFDQKIHYVSVDRVPRAYEYAKEAMLVEFERAIAELRRL